MRVCIVGAGAVGGLLGVKLAAAGEDVSFVDRPSVVSAVRARGMTLVGLDGTKETIPGPVINDDYSFDAPFDLVVLAVKAHQLVEVAPRLSPILADGTAVMTVQNGIPWWYFERHGGEHEGRRLATLDPDGTIAAHIPAEKIIGCVVYPAAQCDEPGVIRHVEGNRFTLGELDGSASKRVEAIAAALISAGFKSYVVDDIRAEIWLKAWGALSFNTLSALTGATMEELCRFSDTRALAETMMREAQVVANRLGIEFRHTIEKRIEGAERVGAHKTSMLQDVEAGRKLEVEALIGAIRELAELTGTPVPSVDAVAAACRLLNHLLPGDDRSEPARTRRGEA